MAYNPFDDVIENDPAYMANGGDPVYNRFGQRVFDDQSYLTDADKVKEQLQEETRGIADIIARTAGPIAGLITDPEAYQQTLDQEQRNKQILESLNITNRQLNKDEMERAKAAGYDPLTPGQALGKISGFMYSDLVKGSENIRAGVDYYDLPDNERTGVAMGIIDLTDIALLPAVFKKLATLGVKKFGKTNLKTMAQDPELQKQFPAETQEILSITGGGFTPTGVVRAAETGTGLASSTPRAGTKKDFLVNYFSDPKATIKTTTSLEDQGINRKDIANFLQEFPEYRNRIQFGLKDAKTIDRLEAGIKKLQAFEGEKIPSLELERMFGLGGKGYLTTILNNKDTVAKGLLTQDQVDYVKSFQTNLSRAELDNSKKLSTIATDLKNNPEFQNLGPTEISNKYKIPLINLQTAISKDPELYALVAKDQKLIGTPDTQMSISLIRKILDPKADDVDVSIITDLYRGTKNIEDYTPSQFLTEFKKQNPNYKKTGFDKNTKKAYQKLEDKRLKIQKESFNFFDKIRKDPRYGKYLKDSDRLQFGFQKAHAFPIDEATQMGRFENMGQMSDMIFVSDMTSNVRLQQRFDGDLIKIGNLGSNKENMDKLATIPTNTDIKFMGINLPKIIERLKEYGINVVPEEFQNMRQLIFGKEKGIRDQIDKLYQKFDTGTLIPFGKKNTGLVGKNPKEVKPEKRLKNLKERFMKILDDQVLYEKTNGKQGKPIMRQPRKDGQEGGFIVGLQDGGEVKPVRMAIGGDPLTNLNQQQFSPDPAFEGQDYFQEAVDSGNLQAANLLNLFKVFKKPKVMATPSNVKKVEEARDPIPAPTGSQEIAPLPAGKQDFFFKSFFLDQLNSQNAPKASTPQGWREFLIKGRKVPEAEMMDTGILQYLEDTEKFFPNKKITKQDLESLYDTSPLGNLEVRVKEIKAPGFDEGQFTLDQGRPRHKGAGNAAIDQAADDYFEVVVNVPQLPGQEKVFVNSGHFSEPNVLGFTRVGTYKNADNQTVAVIQEMQTDMLTEVRKEQERLFAMVNALKRQRADLVNQVEQARNLGPGNVDYATNKLRQFDQKYPESFLNDLAQDNLIQPFPNIVAKELIPEKTRNLNAIQDDINKLSMANVEQYTDPAYKTKIFDLAQEQTKILDDLMSMNRSSNYQEKLQGFKVPSTSDREELRRIGEVDNYLPSGYNMKDLESFPPIPFNKQADYVDLLIKSTIKAAKQKGIDRVAIMPADIGANPRWGKSSDEAKKKFQNLYDKVGVQQLKNIAKKYDGTLNVEKIIDPSKTNRGLTFLNKNPDGEFQFLKQTETKKNVSDAERDAFYDTEITRIASGVNEPGQIVLTREIAPGQMMDYYLVEGRGDATDVGYRMIPLKENENADDALIKIVEYNPSAIDMYTISFDPSKLEEPMYLFKKKSGGTIDKDSLLSITDIYGEYGR